MNEEADEDDAEEQDEWEEPEHKDEDKDSTHAIFIVQSDLHETKLQGEREAEKDKVGMLSSTRLSTCTTKEECETDERPREVATAASTWQDRKSIPSA